MIKCSMSLHKFRYKIYLQSIHNLSPNMSLNLFQFLCVGDPWLRYYSKNKHQIPQPGVSNTQKLEVVERQMFGDRLYIDLVPKFM
jgi:hypothetical protein